MSRVFCPVDFLDTSWLAVKTAYDLAVRSKGVLILMHAYHLDLHIQASNQATWEEQVLREYDIKLDHIIKQLIDYKPDLTVKFEKVLSKGFAVDTIIEESVKCQSDLVVLNSKGSSGFADKVAGSISTNVIESVQIPVLILPKQVEAIQFKNIVLSCLPELIDKTEFTLLVNLTK